MDKIQLISCRSISCKDRRVHRGWVRKEALFNMLTNKLGTYTGVGQ